MVPSRPARLASCPRLHCSTCRHRSPFNQQPTMDYEGQKLSELLFHIIILAFGGVGWIFGYFAQDFSYVFYAWAAGTATSVVLCVPDWPFYNRHPVKWLDQIPTSAPEKKTN